MGRLSGQTALVLAVVVATMVGPRSAAYAANPTEVVLVKRAGVIAYEEVTEAFREGCRVHARVINLATDTFEPSHFSAAQLVITVGQEALDAVTAAPGRQIATMAFHVPGSVLGPRAAPAPELVLKMLLTARPATKIVGVVYGPRSRELMLAAHAAATRLGIELRGVEVDGGPAAVRALRNLVEGVQALWLPGDTDVLTPQLFQYALRLQIERGIPVAAATRQQVHSGALLAVDFDARAAGRTAADLANLILEGRSPNDTSLDLASGARMTVNAEIARRLGADLHALERLGARIE